MNGNGLANADVHNAEVRLGFKLERTVVDGVSKPRLALLGCHVTMQSLTISIEGSWFSWVYNVLTAIFQKVIQEYICATLTDQMLENMSTLLDTLNLYAKDYWPIILKHADVQLDALPISNDEDSAEKESKLPPPGKGEVDVVITEKGALGLRLDSTGKAQYATVTHTTKIIYMAEQTFLQYDFLFGHDFNFRWSVSPRWRTARWAQRRRPARSAWGTS